MENLQKYLDKNLSKVEFMKEQSETAPSFGKVISKTREALGMTQKELSNRTGIPQSNISLIEGDRANPSVKILERLALGMGKKLIIRFE